LFALFQPQLLESYPEPVDDLVPGFAGLENTDTVDLWLLRRRRHAKRKEHSGNRKAEDALADY
jgi:hypothetical protein